MTNDQAAALVELAQRQQGVKITELVARAYYDNLLGVVMVPWCGTMVGIEADGSVHS
jgi:hypothetical protein